MTDLPPISTVTPPKPSYIAEAEAYGKAEPAKVAGFFETHPMANTIGSGIAGALLMLAAAHFLHF